jgi:uncharacterized protein YuzE
MNVKVWYDAEGDYLEVIFEKKEGFFRETDNENVMEKVDPYGNILGFSVSNTRSIRNNPLEFILEKSK